MNRHERIQAALAGKNVDRVPVSAWGHFYHREHTAGELAESMLSFQELYDWDFMKINCRASYHAEGWGYTYRQSGKPGERPVCTGYPLHSLEDWNRLRPLAPDHGPLGEHRKAVDLIRKGLRGRVPFLMTVFSPLMVACFLSNLRSDFQNLPQVAAAIKVQFAENPGAVRQGLMAIAETFAGFIRRLAAAGVDGIYFATNLASDSCFSAAEYRDLARPYDLKVLEAASSLPFNILHLCGNRVHLEAMADYPVAAFHWDMHGEGNADIAEGKIRVTQAVAGGVNRWTIAKGTPNEVRGQALQARRQAKDERFLLAPSCSVAIADSPEDNLRALRTAAQEA